MSLIEQNQKPPGQQQQVEEQLLSKAERAILNHVIRLSLEQNDKIHHKKSEGLKTKYRKMIVNLKMGKSSQTCTVCVEQFQQGQIIKRFPCGHIFHRQCAKQLLKVNKRCPVCRLDIEEFFVQLQKTGNLQYSAMHDKKIKTNNKNKLL